MKKEFFNALLQEKRAEIRKIEGEIDGIRKQYALDALARSGYTLGQRIDYHGKEYEIVGASIFVFPCPDGRPVLKSGELGKDVKQLYNIRLQEE